MNLSFLADMAIALALLALLAESFGAVRRRFGNDNFARFILGVLFGVMAKIQMHQTFEPFEGLIIDMRTIPIALAGGFLGWRGLLPAVILAVAARLQLGGVGAPAGVVGIVIAGLAGIIWARKMEGFESRGYPALVMLALATSSHLFAAVLLPRDLAIWFFSQATAPLFITNLIVIPIIGAMLERENRRIMAEWQILEEVGRDLHTGLLTGRGFVREVTNAISAYPFGTFSGLLVTEPTVPGWRGVFSVWRRREKVSVDPKVLSDTLEHWALAGVSADGRLVVPLSRAEVVTAHRTKARVCETLRSVKGGDNALSTLDLTVHTCPEPGALLAVLERYALQKSIAQRPGPLAIRDTGYRLRTNTVRPAFQTLNEDEHDALFAKAEFLFERRPQRRV